MAAIASVYVEILPETSKIAPEIRNAFRDADRNLPKFTAEADTSKAEAQLDATAKKPRKSTVNADADTAKAEEQLDKVSRERTSKIKANVDTSDIARLNQLIGAGQIKQAQAFKDLLAARREFQSGSGSGDPLGYAQSILNIRQASQAFEQSLNDSVSSGIRSGGTAGISALTPALMGVGIAMAGGIASALAGLTALLPAGIAGAGGVIGTLALGLDGVKDAWDAAGKAAQSSGQDQAAKAREVTSAQRSLRDAVQSEEQAQKDVATARKDALHQLRDLNLELHGGALDEKQAILDARAARRDLAAGRFKDSIEYQQAQLRVQEADQRVAEAHQRNIDLQQKATDERRKGVDGADQVVAANQRLAKAQEQVGVAQDNLNQVSSKQSSSMTALSQAMANLSPNAQAFVEAMRGVKPIFDQLKFSVQDTLLAGLGPVIQNLATTYLPILQQGLGSLASTMNQAFGQFAAFMTQPQTMAAMQQIFANIGSSFGIWAQSLQPVSEAFLTITRVGSTFLPGIAQSIVQVAQGFNQFIQTAASSGQLQQFIQVGITSMNLLGQIGTQLLQIFLNLAPIGPPVLSAVNQILAQIGPQIPALSQSFANWVVAITPLLTALTQLVTWLMPLYTGQVNDLNSSVNTSVGYFSNLSGPINTVKDAIKSLTDLGPDVKGFFDGFKDAIGEVLNPLKGLTDLVGEGKNLLHLIKGEPLDPVAISGQKPTGPMLPNGIIGGGGSFDGTVPGLPPVGSVPGVTAPSAANPGVTPGAVWTPGPGQAPMTWVPGKGWQKIPTANIPTPTPAVTGGGGAGAPAATPSSYMVTPEGVQNAISLAQRVSGQPYGYGGTGDPAHGGLYDCSGFMSSLFATMTGKTTTARFFTTESDLTKFGFIPTSTPVPGTFQVGIHQGGGGMNSHMAGTLPNGVNVESGGAADKTQYGGSAAGAWDKQFEKHYYLPVPPGSYGSQQMMPTVSSGPTGAQNDPFYMQYPEGYKPPGPDMGQFGQTIGGDIWDSILPEGFKNPTQFGGVKFGMGLLSGLLGLSGGKGGGGGMPGWMWGAAGGDGASLPGGGGDVLGSLLSNVPQAFGALKVGSEPDAPGQFMPTMPDYSGGAMPNLPDVMANTAQGGQSHQIDNRIDMRGAQIGLSATDVMQQVDAKQNARARQPLRALPGQ